MRETLVGRQPRRQNLAEEDAYPIILDCLSIMRESFTVSEAYFCVCHSAVVVDMHYHKACHPAMLRACQGTIGDCGAGRNAGYSRLKYVPWTGVLDCLNAELLRRLPQMPYIAIVNIVCWCVLRLSCCLITKKKAISAFATSAHAIDAPKPFELPRCPLVRSPASHPGLPVRTLAT